MPNLYIIAGCNGAGKTTASYIVLPQLLNCKEFVNADIIAAGLSPFNPESVAVSAGRIMLQRIDALMNERVDFAFETTLSTRSYVSFINKAKAMGYEVTLLYFWLSSPKVAIDRVAKQVSKGGHNIPGDVVNRRYHRGLKNLFELYMPICDDWIIINNMNLEPEVVAERTEQLHEIILNNDIWQVIKSQRYDNQ